MTERSGFVLIPMTAWVVAVGLFVLIATAFYYLPFDIHRFGLAEIVIVMAVGAFLSAYVLLAGYVYGDAARRQMPAGLWTLLAVLIPNGLGFVLYFLLRKPMLHACPGCASGVGPDAAYCPRCGFRQIPASAQPS